MPRVHRLYHGHLQHQRDQHPAGPLLPSLTQGEILLSSRLGAHPTIAGQPIPIPPCFPSASRVRPYPRALQVLLVPVTECAAKAAPAAAALAWGLGLGLGLGIPLIGVLFFLAVRKRRPELPQVLVHSPRPGDHGSHHRSPRWGNVQCRPRSAVGKVLSICGFCRRLPSRSTRSICRTLSSRKCRRSSSSRRQSSTHRRPAAPR